MSTIAIFDSGVGGLSVYQEVVKRNPDNNYVFICDNQAFPYGTKTEDELLKRVGAVVARVDEHYAPDLLVVACNTASTVALPILREQFDFPIVGVVPAIKPAASMSEAKVIGLLATPATAGRAYTTDLIDQFAGDCSVIKVGSEELVRLAEDKLYGRPIETGAIEAILKPLIDNVNIDVLVLACTHFPLLNKEITDIFKANNRKVKLMDSGTAIANRVADLTINQNRSSAGAIVVFTESIDDHFAAQNIYQNLGSLGFSEIQLLTV